MRVLLILVAASAAVSAQTVATITSSASLLPTATADLVSSATGGPFTHTVAVAKAGHKYTNDSVLANVGDVIEFQFYPANHSVIRAAYGYPCVPYEMVLGAGHHGFNSGFKPVAEILDEPPRFSITVNDTEPIFYYCGAPNSCIGYQMVGVINPNTSTTLEKQKQLAADSTYMLLPGEDWPTEGELPSGIATPSAVPSPTSTNAATTVTAGTTVQAASKHGLSTGAIAGIAIGGAAVLLAAGVAIWYCGRVSRRSHTPPPIASAQEVQQGFMPAHPSMYFSKPGHMSTVSGYSMPPQYYPDPLHSPTMGRSPVDPMMGQQQPLVHPGGPSPNTANAVPAYGLNHQASMYSVGTHNVVPVEMGPSEGAPPRRSTDKAGVERYS